MRRFWIRAVLLSSIVLLPVWAGAQDTESRARLSDRGRTMLGGSIGGWYSPEEGFARWSVDIQPSFVRFVRDRLGVGMYLKAGVGRRDVLLLDGYEESWVKTVTTSAGGGLQLLYEVELGERLGLLLATHLGNDWWSTRAEGDHGLTRLDQDQHRLELGLSLPLLVHLSDAVGVGFGPYAELAYVLSGRFNSDSPITTQFGLSSTLLFSF